MNKIAYGLLACIVLLIGYAFFFHTRTVPSVPAESEAPYTVELLSADAPRIALSYPRFTASYPDAALINRLIGERVEALRGQFLAETSGAEPSADSELRATPTITLLDDRTVSLFFFVSAYHAGAAHPNAFYETLTIDLAHGRAVGIEDLIAPEAFDELQALVRRTLEASYDTEAFWLDEGLTADPAAFEEFTFTPQGILFLFPPYQLAPYAAGGLEAHLTYGQLRPLAIEESLAAVLASQIPAAAGSGEPR